MPTFSEFSEFHPEWNEAEATIIRKVGPDFQKIYGDNLFSVNVIQTPNIVVGAGYGKTSAEAATNASRIAELLNNYGL